MNSFSKTQKMIKEQVAKDAIYKATLDVIVRREGDSLKMQDIAETAGIATGTLYNYFKNKIQLLTFVDQRLHETILQKLESVTDSDVSPDKKLQALICEILEFFKKHHIVFDLTERLGIKTKTPLSKKCESVNKGYGYIERILTEGIAAGQFREVNIKRMAKYYFSAIIGVLEIRKWLQDYEMAAEADELTDFFLSSLTIRP